MLELRRKRRKIRKLRGSRTCGGGSVKKRKGAGHRGGRGMAGSHKHKWTWIVKYDPDHFGKHGFTPPRRRPSSEINLWQISQMIDRGIAQEREDGTLVLDLVSLGYDRVIGKGELKKPVTIIARHFSEKAIRKIEEVGGAIERLGDENA